MCVNKGGQQNIKYTIQNIQLSITAIGGFLGAFLGGVDGLIYALLTMIVIDYALGLIIAGLTKTLSSAVGFKGIAKKVMMIAFVGVGATIDKHILGSGDIMRTAVVSFYIANEGISIVENAVVLGLPVPQKLKDILIQLRDNKNSDHDNKNNEEDNKDA